MAVNIPIPTEQFSITHKFAQDEVLSDIYLNLNLHLICKFPDAMNG
jgi:hypothetical protein